MAKKKFALIESMFEGQEKKEKLVHERKTMRTSFILSNELVQKLRLLSDCEGITIKEIVDESLWYTIKLYEKKYKSLIERKKLSITDLLESEEEAKV